MAIITDSPLEYIVGTIALLAALIYYYFTRNFKYWEKKGVPYTKPTFFFGNTKGQILFNISQSECTQIVYHELEGHPYGGYFDSSNPVLMIRDPDVIKEILVRDFWHFPGRGLSFDPKNDPLTEHLFNLEGQPWRNLRIKLTPTFTSGKMKAMFPLLLDCAERMARNLADAVRAEGAADARELDVRELCARFSIDVIGSCAFGLNAQALNDPDSEFRAMGRFAQIPPGTARRRLLRSLAPWLPKPRVFNERVTAFFRGLVRSAITHRADPTARRPDFMQLLLQLREHGRVDDDADADSDDDAEDAAANGHLHHGLYHDASAPAGDARPNGLYAQRDVERLELTEDQLAAQVFVFFFAGFETSSVTMTFALYEMALNPEIQERVREEVTEVKSRHDNKTTYMALQEMTYLDQVVQETLRKYPPVGNLTRICRKAYTLPGTEAQLEAGARLTIPAFAIHRDPKHYPEPERFEPGRFSRSQRQRRHPYTYLPFGEGPRICIGSRFGIMQVKMGLSQLISHFHFEVCPNTPIPIVLHPMTAATSPKDKVILNISHRSSYSNIHK